jgi:hypothetical protein
MTDDEDDEILPPEVAGALFKVDPHRIIVGLAELPSSLGLSQEELLDELRSGRLVAEGQRIAGGYQRVGVAGDELVRWLCSDSANARKARRHWLREQIH